MDGFKVLHVETVARDHMRVAVYRLLRQMYRKQMIFFPVGKKRNRKQRLRSVEEPHGAVFFLGGIGKRLGERRNRAERGNRDTLSVRGKCPVMERTAKINPDHIAFA